MKKILAGILIASVGLLEDLNTMLKMGLITQDEYKAKKTEILIL